MKATQGILETAIYARDLDAAEAFYRDVFGLERVSRVPGRLVFFKCGQQMLLVFNPEFTRAEDPGIVIPRHGTEGEGHFCFRARDGAEIDAWCAHFAPAGGFFGTIQMPGWTMPWAKVHLTRPPVSRSRMLARVCHRMPMTHSPVRMSCWLSAPEFQ